jgi:hypothetical protein
LLVYESIPHHEDTLPHQTLFYNAPERETVAIICESYTSYAHNILQPMAPYLTNTSQMKGMAVSKSPAYGYADEPQISVSHSLTCIESILNSRESAYAVSRSSTLESVR